VALANKEALVIAGELVMAQAQAAGVTIRPIDSEHSAVWQCLWGESASNVERLLLTASGGAFRDLTPDQLAQVTPQQALRHPTWLMGPKVTIDSATLMNKGLEVMEAHWLFGLSYQRINVVLHRESVVHSLVEFIDGSVKAQLGVPDMRLPIQCALSYPERLAAPFPKLNLLEHPRLTFGAVDLGRYPCLRLALQSGLAGGTFPAVLSAADEEAVALFLAGHLPFQSIAGIVETVLDRHQSTLRPDLQTILEADAWARRMVAELHPSP
jgi:1-deoxy-D-xylulose-5-phosphate reductoisomerase